MLVLSLKSTLKDGIVICDGLRSTVVLPVDKKVSRVRTGISGPDDVIILRLETLYRLVQEEVDNEAPFDDAIPYPTEQVISDEVHLLCMKVQVLLETDVADGQYVDQLRELLNTEEMIELICGSEQKEMQAAA